MLDDANDEPALRENGRGDARTSRLVGKGARFGELCSKSDAKKLSKSCSRLCQALSVVGMSGNVGGSGAVVCASDGGGTSGLGL